jgi:putative membrane protein insertion efficiency factor
MTLLRAPSPAALTSAEHPRSPSLPGRALVAALRFYQRRLSPLKGAPSCRYLPTCSEYAVQAVRRHGAIKGAALAAARILRCNPFFHAGYHPVPEAGRWAACEHEGSH